MSEKSWTTLELIRWTTGYFRQHGIVSPRLDAELLLAHSLGVDRVSLYTAFDKPVTSDERTRYRRLIRGRAESRVPVAYLTGIREFWSREFRVSPAVLIPRPETETLVRVAASFEPDRIVEVGVGSGAVSAALAIERPDASLVGTDCSPEALAVAAANLEALGLADRVALVEADGLEGVGGEFDLVVSNPPYVPSTDIERLEPELLHEPRLALDGGSDGLDFIRRLAAAAPERLAPGGCLLIEVGADQAAAASAVLAGTGAESVRPHLDLAGVERVLEARFSRREQPA